MLTDRIGFAVFNGSRRLVAAAFCLMAAILSGLQGSRGVAADAYIAVGSYRGSFAIRNFSDVSRPGTVCFFDCREFAFRGAMSLPSFPFIARSPTRGNFLIALRTGGVKANLAKVYEYSPSSASVVRARTINAAVGDRNPQTYWWFRTGPDGVLWIVSGGGRIEGVRWPSIAPIFSEKGPAVPGALIMLPISGGLVTVDARLTVTPDLAALATPQMHLLSETGKYSPIDVPRTLRGIPLLMSARGRTLSGITAFSRRFVKFTVGQSGVLTHVIEHRLSKKLPFNVFAFHQLGRALGVALASGPKGVRPVRTLFFISIPTGKVIRTEKVSLDADDMVVLGGRIYLVCVDGRIAQVSPDGHVARLSNPPFITVSAIGHPQ